MKKAENKRKAERESKSQKLPVAFSSDVDKTSNLWTHKATFICCFLATSWSSERKNYFSPAHTLPLQTQRKYISAITHNIRPTIIFLSCHHPSQQTSTHRDSKQEEDDEKSMHTQRMENPVESNKVRYKIILYLFLPSSFFHLLSFFIFPCQQFFSLCCFSFAFPIRSHFIFS